MKEFVVGLRAKTYSYLMDGDSDHKKAKGTKQFVLKKEFMIKNYTDYLFKDKIIKTTTKI